MFDISWGELVLIGMVALIVIGPKELPTVLRTVGQWMTKIRRMAAEFQGQFQEAMREAEFADLKKQVDSITDTSQYNPLETIQKEVDSAFSGQAVTPSGEPSASAPVEAASAEPAVSPPPAATVTPSGEPVATVASSSSEPAASTEPAAPASKPNDLEGGRAA